MARVTYVAKSQQRFARVPVLDADGKQKRSPVKNRDGSQKTDKHGRLVFIALSQPDLSQPLPGPTCDFCHEEIAVGSAYKHVSPKSGPYGGITRYRHAAHPDWQVWELSSSMSARIAEIVHNFETGLSDVNEPSDAESVQEEAAAAINELAEEKREAAQNMEEGFGHETEQSTELNDIADQLESWASEIEGDSIPELPEPEEDPCEDCDGTGKVAEDGPDSPDCETCSGTGTVTPDEPTEEQMDEWRQQVEDELSAIQNSPF